MRYLTKARQAALFVVLSAALPLMGSCPQSGGTELPINSNLDLTVKLVGEAAVRVACYIDTEQYNPLNALDYTLGKNGPPYFDYVGLGAARLKKDTRGVYMNIPPGLYHVLENRFTYIVPLQKRGIKVLLSLTGGRDGVSFGSITDDERKGLAFFIVRILDLYSLDGVELYDTDAAQSPDNFPYPEGDFIADDGSVTHIRAENSDSAELAWITGGDRMTDLIWTIREQLNESLRKAESGKTGSMIDSLGLKVIIVREENYGKYLREDVPGGYFISRDDQLNFVVNPDFTKFGYEDAGKSCLFNLDSTQYGPLAVNLGASPVVPDEQTLQDFSDRFAEAGNYGIIFYSNLKPVSRSNLDQRAYMSITSRAVFGKDVDCTGGDYR